ncbi:MAG TPA: magnesium chelatase subunit D family protein [Methanospirillum sp.]|uniref:magnesium chelatase subunit D family protein n=1 Tax=Methanospirillum sp. TaxID=45200 RepID=UPI002BAB8CC5|nr:magnesium chelatase subunit D family protein [Methanospirillum sp.]HWQ64789.1 magnesium chelatase subunit D family protein [Methanospirillum sp.]
MPQHLKKPLLPFTAIVGQNQMKRALILNAINPSIGGVLIRGEKGTAKSSAVRALSEILPSIQVILGCPFSCDPDAPDELCELCQAKQEAHLLPTEIRRQVKVVNLPVGATEDRVVGTIDIESALKEGIKSLEPGILADANRGILYIDEVNLLDDHVVDLLLDAAAMGVNTVEREGISFSHPARFILIGTMNPEEGELRPQLLDRFGLQVTVETLDNPNDRIAIVRTAEEYLADPWGFSEKYQPLQNKLAQKILEAKDLLKRVLIPDDLIRKAVEICIELGVKTHRAEITIVRTARTIAAFEGHETVNSTDLKEAIELALPHRMRKRPFEEPKIDHDRLDDLMNGPDKPQDQPKEENKSLENQGSLQSPSGQSDQPSDKQSTSPSSDDANSTVHAIGSPIDAKQVIPPGVLKIEERYAQGRRFETSGPDPRGKYVKAFSTPQSTDIAFDATIRSVAHLQHDRKTEKMAVVIRKDELLKKFRVGKTATACLFVVDASGSMGARMRMEAAKGAIFSLLEDSYQNRDRVGLIAFKGMQADLILPLSSSIDLAYSRLCELPTGGRTPLASGLLKAFQVLMNEKLKYPSLVPTLILISDGRANVSVQGSIKSEIIDVSEDMAKAGIQSLIIDTEEQNSGLGIQLGFCRIIAEHTHGRYFRIQDLTAHNLSDIVRAGISDPIMG